MSVVNTGSDLHGMFYIVRGGYVRDKEPTFFNEVSETYNSIGGYDPEDTTNEEWYMLMDKELFLCQAASHDFNKVLEALHRLVVKYRTRDHYLEVMESLRAYRTASRIQRRLEQEVFDTYGDYYEPEIEDAINDAYKWLRENSPAAKARKRGKSRLVRVSHT